jgi:hypothetical protein
MSKKSKSAAKLRRKSLKAGRKAAQKAKYTAFAASGSNSKRSKARNKRASGMARSKRHADGPCGNIGCAIDNPADYNLLTPAQLSAKR